MSDDRLLARAGGVAALLVVLALSSCSRKPSKAPAAGLYALRGGGKVTRDVAGFVRSPRPGMTLSFDMVLELEGEAVLEGVNGTFVALGSGRHRIASLNALYLQAPARRRVLSIADAAEEREVGTLVEASRYEPLESGKPLENPGEDSFASNVAFLFLPQGGGQAEDAERPQGVPPWSGPPAFIRPLRRPLAPGDGLRMLVQAAGAVVVEFEDRATALTSALELPLDLAGVRRIVVAVGSARIALPGGKVADLAEGQVAEVAPLP